MKRERSGLKACALAALCLAAGALSGCAPGFQGGEGAPASLLQGRSISELTPEARKRAEKEVRRWADVLERGDLQHCMDASYGLWSFGELSVPHLSPLTAHSSGSVRFFAIFTLGLIGPGAEQALPSLLLALQDTEGLNREAASAAIVRIGPAAVPLLAQSLRNPGSPGREEMVATLTSLGRESPLAVFALIDALREGDESLRAEAARALGRLGEEAFAAVPSLLRALEDESAMVRGAVLDSLTAIYPFREEGGDPFQAVRVIERLGREGEAAVPLLSRALREGGGFEREAAARSLSMMGPDAVAAVPELTAALRDGRIAVRRYAAAALGGIGPGALEALPGLVEMLKSPDPSTRHQAALSLGRIGPAAVEAVPALMELARSDDLRGQREAAFALVAVGAGYDAAIPILTAVMAEGERGFEEARASLVRIGPPAVPALAGLTGHSSPAVRLGAARALGEIGSGGEVAVRALVSSLKAEDSPVVGAGAIVALGRVLTHFEPGTGLVVEAMEEGEGPASFAFASALLCCDADSGPALEVIRGAPLHRSKTIHFYAALGLKCLGERGVGEMAERLEDDSPVVRSGALSVLSAMGPEAEPAVPALIELITTDRGSLGREAILALRHMGPGAREAVPLLLEILDDHRKYMRSAARRTLRIIAPEALLSPPD